MREDIGARTVARPKQGEKPKHVTEAQSGPPDPDKRITIIHLQGSSEYFDFVDKIVEKSNIPKSTQFRVAYREWCERNDHGSPPKI